MNTGNMQRLTLAMTLGLCFMFSSFNSFAGKLYKWVDEEGNVHFSDAIPPENIKDKHSTLTDGGMEIDSVDKQKTAQERLQAKQLEEDTQKKQAEETRQKNTQIAYDRQLLSTYLTEQDLISMRDRQIATIEGTITLTKSSLGKLEAQLEKYQSETNSSDPESEANKKHASQIVDTQKQISEYKLFIANRYSEQKKIKNKFDADLARLRLLLSSGK